MKMTFNTILRPALLALPLVLAACGDDGGSSSPTDPGDPPTTYSFDSRFEDGSSVSYSGQTFRQLLIERLKAEIGGLTGAIDQGTFLPDEEGEVVALLDYYFRFDSDAYGTEAIGLSTTPAALQQVWNDLSTDKDLVGKIAGNDATTDHRDWDGGAFAGWSDASIAEFGGSIDSPEGFVVALFEQIENNALLRADGTLRAGPDGADLPVYVTESGVDLQQLSQKFLLMAVNFSQCADDYLDDDTAGKGLLASNAGPAEEGAAYTELEHQWDEGFGYFGAARDYGDYSDEEIAAAGGREGRSSGYHDTDGDGAIDLRSEFNFGASTNAAKRDRGAVEATDFTGRAFGAFVAGRHLIASIDGELDDAQIARLGTFRDEAVAAWEEAIAATVVHYINKTLQLMATFGTEDYDFLAHAKAWSEMKGFAMGLQFNPRSPMLDDFETFHDLVRDAPVLPGSDEVEAYRGDLLAARALLGDAYGFSAANLGDDDGNGGW